MRELVALTFVLLSTAASAEEWVVIRKPSDPGQAGTPAILVDSTSIEILDSGIRRARGKFDFLADGRKFEASGPPFVTMMIWVKSYDCEKQMTREDLMESHGSDGSIRTLNLSNNAKWYPAPANRLADPTIEFVCRWKSK